MKARTTTIRTIGKERKRRHHFRLSRRYRSMQKYTGSLSNRPSRRSRSRSLIVVGSRALRTDRNEGRHRMRQRMPDVLDPPKSRELKPMPLPARLFAQSTAIKSAFRGHLAVCWKIDQRFPRHVQQASLSQEWQIRATPNLRGTNSNRILWPAKWANR